MYCNSLLLD